MAKPSYQCLLEGVHPEKDCTPSGCVHLQDALRALRTPTIGDLEHLLTMYGERPNWKATKPRPPVKSDEAAE
jgi:hypothetical protein